MNELIGKKISEVRINNNNTVITFITDQGPIQYFAEGDCCSTSWIEHVADVKDIVGKEILAVEQETAINNMEGMLSSRGKADHMDVYFYRIKATESKYGYGGVMVIDLRNDSNGYYGGTLTLAHSIEDFSNHKIITEDF